MISSRLFWVTISFFIVAKSTLVGWWPFLVLTTMPHDASLFVNQAVSIREGNWLGPYSEYTLMKGPMTPMWMAFTNFLGVPYLFSLHILYVSGCILFLFALRKFITHRGFLLAAFLFLLFNPYSFAYGPLASGFREGLHQPLLLMMIALSVILFVDYVRYRKVQLELSILFGVVFFMFWNNREEGIWTFPYFSVLILSMFVALWLRRDEENNRVDLIKLAQVIMIPLVIWWVGTMGIAWKNYLEYDVFAVVELKTPEFGEAYGRMISIEPKQWSATKTLQPDVLDKFYSLPSGDTLDLNDKRGQRHTLHNTNAVWIFRRAVAKAGYYEKGGAAVLGLYARIGDEIKTACAEQKFDCGSSLLNALPPWRSEYSVLFIQTIWDALAIGLVNPYDRDVRDFYSIAGPLNMLSVSHLVNTPARVEEASHHFLPSFFRRTIRIKTKYEKKLQRVYHWLVPVLFGLTVLGLISRVTFLIRTRNINALDPIFFGLGISVIVLLSLFTLMMITGITQSSRLYFLFYPVFYPFLLVGLLSLARDAIAFKRRTGARGRAKVSIDV